MKIYLSFGSNLGNRLENISRAVELLRRRLLPDLRCSIIIETEAIVPDNAPADWSKPYLNMVAVGDYDGGVKQWLGLLVAIKAIEIELGRPAQAKRWAPRIIDIDILLVGDETVNLPQLCLPHPELQNRPFLLHLLAVLDPLFECLPHSPLQAHAASARKSGEVEKQNTSCFSRSFVLEPKFVGIVNVTPDSFSDGGRYLKPDSAIERSLELADQGAAVIDIGAQSTRPEAELISPEAEYNLLEPVLDGLLASRSFSAGRDAGRRISIDSFNGGTIEKILKRYQRIAWVNDQSGKLNARTLSMIVEAGCSIVVMHALTLPASRTEHIPNDADPVEVVNSWAEREVERLGKCGFKPESIILDPGIGFGKSAYQSLALIRNVAQLKRFGCKLLVGHSRKSFMTSFARLRQGYGVAAADRDIETVGISSWLAEQGVDYLRVHNVEMHQRWFVARQVVAGESSLGQSSGEKR